VTIITVFRNKVCSVTENHVNVFQQIGEIICVYVVFRDCLFKRPDGYVICVIFFNIVQIVIITCEWKI